MLYTSRVSGILETVTPFGEVPCIEIVVGGVSCVNEPIKNILTDKKYAVAEKTRIKCEIRHYVNQMKTLAVERFLKMKKEKVSEKGDLRLSKKAEIVCFM